MSEDKGEDIALSDQVESKQNQPKQNGTPLLSIISDVPRIILDEKSVHVTSSSGSDLTDSILKSACRVFEPGCYTSDELFVGYPETHSEETLDESFQEQIDKCEKKLTHLEARIDTWERRLEEIFDLLRVDAKQD